MYIDFERLRDKGWHVEPMKEGVHIQGTEPMPILAKISADLEQRGLGRVETEVMVEQFGMKIEAALILKDLT